MAQHEQAQSPNSILEGHIKQVLHATVVKVAYDYRYKCTEVHLCVEVGNLRTTVIDKLSSIVPGDALAAKYKTYLKMFEYKRQVIPKNVSPGDILINAWNSQWAHFVHRVDVIPYKTKTGRYIVYLRNPSRVSKPYHKNKKINLTQTELNLD